MLKPLIISFSLNTIVYSFIAENFKSFSFNHVNHGFNIVHYLQIRFNPDSHQLPQLQSIFFSPMYIKFVKTAKKHQDMLLHKYGIKHKTLTILHHQFGNHNNHRLNTFRTVPSLNDILCTMLCYSLD